MLKGEKYSPCLRPNGVSGSSVPFLQSYCKKDTSFSMYGPCRWNGTLGARIKVPLATLGRSVLHLSGFVAVFSQLIFIVLLIDVHRCCFKFGNICSSFVETVPNLNLNDSMVDLHGVTHKKLDFHAWEASILALICASILYRLFI